jgi:hypothetical protein
MGDGDYELVCPLCSYKYFETIGGKMIKITKCAKCGTFNVNPKDTDAWYTHEGRELINIKGIKYDNTN